MTMIDLAALTQALEHWESYLAGIHTCDVGEEEAVAILRINEAARIPTRLWQPCPKCDGTGEGGFDRNSSHAAGEYVAEDCRSCGGVGVEPTPQAVEALYQAVFSPRDNTRPAMEAGLMALWRVANEETD